MPSPKSPSPSVVVNRSNQPVEVHLAGFEVLHIDPLESVTVALGEGENPHLAELERLQIVEVLPADEAGEGAGDDAGESGEASRSRRSGGRTRRTSGEGAKG